MSICEKKTIAGVLAQVLGKMATIQEVLFVIQ